MKKLRLHYTDGNTIDIKAYDYEFTNDYLKIIQRKSDCKIPYLYSVRIKNIERVEELWKY